MIVKAQICDDEGNPLQDKPTLFHAAHVSDKGLYNEYVFYLVYTEMKKDLDQELLNKVMEEIENE